MILAVYCLNDRQYNYSVMCRILESCYFIEYGTLNQTHNNQISIVNCLSLILINEVHTSMFSEKRLKKLEGGAKNKESGCKRRKDRGERKNKRQTNKQDLNQQQPCVGLG